MSIFNKKEQPTAKDSLINFQADQITALRNEVNKLMEDLRQTKIKLAKYEARDEQLEMFKKKILKPNYTYNGIHNY